MTTPDNLPEDRHAAEDRALKAIGARLTAFEKQAVYYAIINQIAQVREAAAKDGRWDIADDLIDIEHDAGLLIGAAGKCPHEHVRPTTPPDPPPESPR